MKSLWKSILTCVVVMVAGLASGQTINPPPCDFSDVFYTQNGVDPTSPSFVGRFGDARQTGPPAIDPTQVNWVADTNCSANDPTRRDIRILATTGAFAAKYFSIIAFMVDASVFEKNVTLTEGTSTISYDANGANPRGYTTQFMIQSFLAFGAPTQKMANGGLAPTPCGSLHDPNLGPDCFTVGTTSPGHFAVETPNLRQDWNIQSNNNAIDGTPDHPAASDLNCVDTTRCGGPGQPPLRDSPFGYFCDDLLGTWLIHYWWFTQNAIGGTDINGNPITPTQNCNTVLACASQVNGNSLDRTPVIKNEGQLNFLKGVSGTDPKVLTPACPNPPCQPCVTANDLPPAGFACAADHAIPPSGIDGGAVWMICPDLDDPRNGAIAPDAFLDAVRNPDGTFLDKKISDNFTCLQQTGQLCP